MKRLKIGDKVIRRIFDGSFLILTVFARSHKTVDAITETGYNFSNQKVSSLKLYDEYKSQRLHELSQTMKRTRREINEIYDSLEDAE